MGERRRQLQRLVIHGKIYCYRSFYNEREGRSMDEEIFTILERYIDRYQWRWNRACRIINLYFGTQYTEKQLIRLYRQRKKEADPHPAE